MGGEVRELAIIGSGPAGYTAAIYAARADLTPLVFEGVLSPGGALMTTTEVENFPGFPAGITGPELMGAMRGQAARFGTELLPEDIVEIRLDGEDKVLVTDDGDEHRARAVILATGSAYRRIGAAGEDRLAGRGVSWCATCDAAFFRGGRVAVIGGGDSALEEADFLSRFAASVMLVHRRDALRASKAMIRRMEANPAVSVLWNKEVAAFDGDSRLSRVVLRDTIDGTLSEHDIDGAFVAIGHDPRSELVKGLVDLTSSGHVAVAAGTTLTSRSGIFACGDVVDSRYQQAVTAAASGCQAALDVERYLYSRMERLSPALHP